MLIAPKMRKPSAATATAGRIVLHLLFIVFFFLIFFCLVEQFVTRNKEETRSYSEFDFSFKNLHSTCAEEKRRSVKTLLTASAVEHCLSTYRCQLKGNPQVVTLRRNSYHSHSYRPVPHQTFHFLRAPYDLDFPLSYTHVMEDITKKWKGSYDKSIFVGMPTVLMYKLSTVQRPNRTCPLAAVKVFPLETQSTTCDAHTHETLMNPAMTLNIKRLLITNPLATLMPSSSFQHKHYITFLEPLGSGSEAEVWRTCITMEDRAQILAAKVIRRFTGTYTMKTEGHVWKKMKTSAYDCLRYINLIPHDIILVPHAVYLHRLSRKSYAVRQPQDDRNVVVYSGMVIIADIAVKTANTYVTKTLHPTEKLRRTAFVGYQMLRIIEALYRVNIVWMDCKLSNILVFNDDDVRIGDTGLMRVDGTILRYPRPGTRRYRPPEAYNDDDIAQATVSWPLFSLGVSLYVMLTGTYPWKSEYNQEFNTDRMTLLNPNDRLFYIHKALNTTTTTPMASLYIELLQTLLNEDPVKRGAVSQIMSHGFWRAALTLPRSFSIMQ